MFIYLLNVVVVLSCMVTLEHCKKKQTVTVFKYEITSKQAELYLVSFALFQLFLTTVLKSYNVGSDVLVYKEGFESISKLSWSTIGSFDWEIGYVFINKLISVFTNNFFFLILIMYIAIYILLYKYIISESKLKLLSIYLFIVIGFSILTFSSYRQSIALMITTLSIKFVKERKLSQFLLTVGLATSFHYSAIVFIIAYLLPYIKINRRYIVVVGLGCVFLLLFGKTIAKILVSLYNPNYEVVQGEGYKLFSVYLAIVVSALGVYFYNTSKGLELKNVELSLHLMIIATVLQMLSFNLSIFVRVVIYFSFSLIILIPNVIMSIQNIKYRKIALVFTVIFTFMFFILFLRGNPYSTIPYKFLWS